MVWNNKDWRDVFPIKDKVENLIGLVPEWFVLLRKDDRFKCTECYDPTTGESNTIYCPVCWGTTNRVVPLIIPGRIEASVSSNEGDIETGAGFFNRKYDTFHTIRAAYPSKQDVILQVGWNVPSREIGKNPSAEPVELIKAYRIDEIVRPYQKEIAWLKIQMTSFNQDFSQYEANLYRLADSEVITI